MNTLRKLEERLGQYRDTRREWRDRCTNDKAERLACYESAQAYDQAQAELSAELPKWERLVVTANDAADWLNFLVRNDNGAALKALQELRAALSEVRHD